MNGMGDDTDHYHDALLEEIRSDIKSLAEAFSPVPADIRKLKEDVSQLASDMSVVKAVVTDHSALLLNHDQRISNLEAA